MILKEADERKRDIDTLRALQSHPKATPATSAEIALQIRKIQAGTAGENDAAYYLKMQYGENRNTLVINDLRIEVDDAVAQIDHIILNRLLDCWLCESKSFASGIKINDHGEFVTFYNRIPQGVPSPIEQNARHVTIMQRLFASGKLTLPKRLGMTMKPNIKTLVLIAKGSIQRPDSKIKGLETIIKADQVASTIERVGDSGNPLDLAKIVSRETLMDLGQQLVALHRPIQFDWSARFGLPVTPVGGCDNCNGRVTDAERQFCEERSDRFQGKCLCMKCQRATRKPTSNSAP